MLAGAICYIFTERECYQSFHLGKKTNACKCIYSNMSNYSCKSLLCCHIDQYLANALILSVYILTGSRLTAVLGSNLLKKEKVYFMSLDFRFTEEKLEHMNAII